MCIWSVKKIASLSLALMFLAMVFTPFCLWLMSSDQERSGFEKRTLQELPRCALKWQSLVTFPKRMEKYYRDHFGLRDQLIAWHNLIHVRLFRKSPNDAVTLGSENWLFYNADHCLADFLGLWRGNREQFEAWRRIIRDRQIWLADRGVNYLVVIVPTKMMVYPQFLPLRIREFAGVAILEEFLRYVRDKDGGHGLVDLLDPLHELEPYPSFFRTDTHWNGLGAFRAYKVIMEDIRQWYPEITPLHEARIRNVSTEFRGDLSTMLNLSSQLREQSVRVRISDPCSREIESDEQGSLLRVESECVDNPHTLLMIHDSYGMYIRPFFDETFRRVLYTRTHLPQLKEVVARESPSVIVDQVAARYFSRMLGQDVEITNYVMRKHWRNSKDLRLYIDRDGGGEHLRSRHHLMRISHDEKGVLLHATGPDPHVELRFPHTPVPDSFLIHMELTSPGETTMQFFYTTGANPSFVPERVISRELKKGYNELLFRLPHPDIQGRLRFDPGMIKGSYILHSLRIKGEWYGI